MLRLTRQLLLFASIYAIGLVVLWWGAIHNLFIDYAGKDAIAFWVVMPLAWTLSYWPMVGSLVTALKVRRLHATLEEIVRRARANDGRLVEADREALLTMLTDLASSESHLPRFIVRPLMRRFLAASASRQTEAEPA